MSLTKRALAEDIDITDPREPGYEEDPNEPTQEDLKVGFTMQDLSTAIKRIEEDPEAFRSQYDELDGLSARMQDIIAKLDKPF